MGNEFPPKKRISLKRQANALGLTLHVINIPYPCSNEECDTIMHSFIDSANEDGSAKTCWTSTTLIFFHLPWR